MASRQMRGRLAAAVSALVVTCSLAWASPAVADASTGTTVTTLSANSTVASARIGTTNSLVATLTAPGASAGDPRDAVGGATVVFDQLGTDHTLAQVGTAVTDGTGVARLALPVAPGTNTYEATFAGDDVYAPSTSQSFTVTGTADSTSMAISAPATDADGATIHLSATWSYADPGIAVGPVTDAAVQVFRHGAGSAWSLFKTLRTDAHGRVSWTAAPMWDSYWKVVGTASPRALAATSAVAYVREVLGAKVYALPRGAPRPVSLPAQPRTPVHSADPVVTTLTNATWKSMVGVSWHRGCPVGRSGLRSISINYYGFDGYRHRGQLVVSARAVRDFVGAFTALFNARIPLHGMYRVDRFGYSKVTGGANDYASMRHDNTSAFNCRWVDGAAGAMSPHATGLAVDINPFENPYDSRAGWTPNVWWSRRAPAPYTWRTPQSQVVRIMAAHGFRWTYGIYDSQHFDAVSGLT